MSEDALIRLENLKRLGKTAKQLEADVGGRYTYWRDMLLGNKSFGEKAARKIEEAYGLARGALDQSGATNAAATKPNDSAPRPAALGSLDLLMAALPDDFVLRASVYNLAAQPILAALRQIREATAQQAQSGSDEKGAAQSPVAPATDKTPSRQDTDHLAR